MAFPRIKSSPFLFHILLAALFAVAAVYLYSSWGLGNTNTTVQRIVIFEEGFHETSQDQLIEGFGGTVIQEIPFINAKVIKIHPDNEGTLSDSPGVKSVEEDADIYASPVQKDTEEGEEEKDGYFTISASEWDAEMSVASGKTAVSITRHVPLGPVERGKPSGSGSVAILNTGDTPVTLGVKGQNAIGAGFLDGHQLRLVETSPRGDGEYQSRLIISELSSPIILDTETKGILHNQGEEFLLREGAAIWGELQVNIPGGAPAGMYSTSLTVVANPLSEVEDYGQTIPWGVEKIDAPAAWKRSKGSGVKVGVIDTGISKNHPDLKVAGGYSVSSLGGGSNDWDDAHGHGTHVAGIIAALDNDIGVVGVAPEAELYAIKVMDDSGRGSLSGILEGFQWAIENKIGVINISLTSDKPVPALEECIRAARAAGILTVVAGGNSGPEEDTLRYPASYEDCIAVVATDADNTVADLSSKGIGLDLVAPGVKIRSTGISGDYENQSGTSMAAAHVTGAIALLLGSGMPVDAVYYFITGMAQDLGYPATWQGAGLVKVYIL